MWVSYFKAPPTDPPTWRSSSSPFQVANGHEAIFLGDSSVLLHITEIGLCRGKK